MQIKSSDTARDMPNSGPSVDIDDVADIDWEVDRDLQDQHAHKTSKTLFSSYDRLIAKWATRLSDKAALLVQPSALWARSKPVLLRWASVDSTRLGLFVPVCLGVGIGFYFNLSAQPSLLLVLLGCLFVATTLFGMSRIRLIPCFSAMPLFFVLLGFVSAAVRVSMVAGPVIENNMNYAAISGRMISIEERPGMRRMVIKPEKIEGLQQSQLPKRIRLSWRGKGTSPKPGDLVSLRAGLGPLPPPVMPGGYDFARQLYFQKIGGVGFIISKIDLDKDHVNGTHVKSYREKIALRVELIRQGLYKHILAAAPGQGGAIVGAIVTGKREGIGEEADNALRDSGLAHLLAISGLHMGLAAGLIFFGVRFLLALHPLLILKYPIKKWAAWAALASGSFYLILSGSGWSARRAFITTLIIFFAILADRRAFSLRNVAVAATIILVTTPEALIHPGFQMSFAAVTALIAAYEWGTQRQQNHFANNIDMRKQGAAKRSARHHGGHPSIFYNIRKYAIGILLTDLIAALATAPFALYHFHRTALYSLPANLIAMPLMGFWIMPMIILAIILMPLDLDGFFWRLAARGVEVILMIGNNVSSWPNAVSVIPSQSLSWLIILSVGGLILCLLRAPWRLAGVIAVPVAIIISFVSQTPDIFITDEGENVAIYHRDDDDKKLLIYNRRRDRFAAKIWSESTGIDTRGAYVASMRKTLPCDDVGCIYQQEEGKMTIAISEKFSGLDRDCNEADFVIALYPVNRRIAPNCNAILVDRRAIWEGGAHAIWLKDDNKIKLQSVKSVRGTWPWTDT